MELSVKEHLPQGWWEVAKCVDVYEAARQRGSPDLRELVEGLSPEQRPAALAELAAVDMEHHWEAGEPKTVEQYLQEFPEILAAARFPEGLIAQEFQLRCEGGEKPALDEYRRRFPDYDIERIIGLADTCNFTCDTDPPAAKKPAIDQPPATIGRYTVREEIGAGAFGRVFRCHDEKLNRDVAVKLARVKKSPAAERREQFLHEARSAARLQHPWIVAVLDAGELEDGRAYVVYEYVTGQTLRARITAGEFSRDEAIEWCAEIAEALHYAHTRQVVHRDVSPENVLLDQQGRTRLTDFGLAKVDDQYFRDDSGRVLGRLAYISPEQARGQSHWASAQSDIYSLGVILYELLTGRRPFDVQSPRGLEEVLAQIEQRTPSPPRTIDDAIPIPLESICLKAMAKDPADRYTTAADMARELRALAGRKPISPWGSSWLAWGLGGIVPVVALLFAAVLLLRNPWPDPSPPPEPPPPVAAHLTMELLQPGGKFIPLEGEDAANYLPLRDGDYIRLKGAWPKGKYAYLFGFFPSGCELLWWNVRGPAADEQSGEFIYPDSEGVVPIESEDVPGPEMFILAVADRQLAQPEIDDFKTARFEPSNALKKMLEGQFRHQVIPFPTLATDDHEITRGVGGRVATADVNIGKTLKSRLQEFSSYQALIYWHSKGSQ